MNTNNPQVNLEKFSNIDLEMAVLSSLMSIDDSYTEVSHIIKPTDFRAIRHQLIYEAIISLSNANMPYDAVMVQDKLLKEGKLENAGGEEHLAKILASSPATLFNLVHYAQQVRENSALYQADQLLIKARDMLTIQDNYQAKINLIIESLIGIVDENTTMKGAEAVSELIPDYMNDLKRKVVAQETPFIKTGFEEIDNKVNIQGGELLIIAGRPAQGKTTLAQNILQNIVIHNRNNVGMFFSLEMSKEQVLHRLFASTTTIHLSKMISGQGLNEEEWGRIATTANDFTTDFTMIIDDRPKLTINEMRSVLNKQRLKHGKIDVIVVDYIQNMGGLKGSGGERSALIGDIVEDLKAFSKEYACPVIALSQLNRTMGYPRMENLSESGGIERTADHLWAIYHPTSDDDTPPSNVAEIHILKNRQGEDECKIELLFKGEYNRFENNIPDKDMPFDWIKLDSKNSF